MSRPLERQLRILARSIGWLATNERKYYLLCTGKTSNNYWTCLRNLTSKMHMVCKVMDIFCHLSCFLVSTFLQIPVWQISTANWLTGFIGKEILFISYRKGYILPCKLFAVIDVSMNVNCTNYHGQLTEYLHMKGNCLLCKGAALKKKIPAVFWKNSHLRQPSAATGHRPK